MSLSDKTLSSSLCLKMTSYRKTYTKSSIVLSVLNGTSIIYFVNLSIMIRIESYPAPITGSINSGNSLIKSYNIDLYGFSSIGVMPICL